MDLYKSRYALVRKGFSLTEVMNLEITEYKAYLNLILQEYEENLAEI